MAGVGGRIDMDESGSPKTGYHSRSHLHHIENSPHIQHQPYETESDMIPSPVIIPTAGSAHSGYRTKTRGKKHKKQPGTVPAVISSVEVTPVAAPAEPAPALIRYSTGVDLHSDYFVEATAAQASLLSDPLPPPIYSEVTTVAVEPPPPVILNAPTCDDVEIVPPPPLPTDGDSEMQQFLKKDIQPIEPPQSFFGVPDLTSQPRKWSIASGDKPVNPKLMAGEMIDVVRTATGLSHKKCQMAAQVVLGYIQVGLKSTSY